MTSNNNQPTDSSPQSKPDPEFIASQLRKPSGDFADEISEKMNVVNEPLYDLMLDTIDVGEYDRMLEIGFGNGKFFEKLFDENEFLHIDGIDHSEEMVESAKSKNQNAISGGRLELKQGSSDNLPYNDNDFDVVFCNMVIYFWEDPKLHLKEILRVIKPGGIFLTGLRTLESMMSFPFVEHGFTLYKIEEWEQILGKNGFSVTDSRLKFDPPIELENDQIQLESCCIVAEKS